MSTKETGGPAFPATEEHGLNSGMPGMTLRDYFAAKAMQGELAAMTADCHGNSGCDIEIHDKILLTLTKHWYRIADSMLEARKS